LCRQRKHHSVGAARSALPQDDFRRRRSAHDELAAHSITSSARASRVGGISNPMRLAVLKVDHELEFHRLQDWWVGGLS
jgi:hypothetical protein